MKRLRCDVQSFPDCRKTFFDVDQIINEVNTGLISTPGGLAVTNGPLSVLIAKNTVVSTPITGIVETAFDNINFQIDPHSLRVGSVLCFLATGKKSTSPTTPGTLNLRLLFDFTDLVLLVATGNKALNASTVNEAWFLEVSMRVTAIGGGGTALVGGFYHNGRSAGPIRSSAGGLEFDIAKDVQLTAKLSAAGNSIECENAFLWRAI